MRLLGLFDCGIVLYFINISFIVGFGSPGCCADHLAHNSLLNYVLVLTAMMDALAVAWFGFLDPFR